MSTSGFECWKLAKASRTELAQTLLITAKSALQPAFELAEQKLQVGSRGLLEQVDDARTQTLPGVIRRRLPGTSGLTTAPDDCKREARDRVVD
jgi:hypothetical protein